MRLIDDDKVDVIGKIPANKGVRTGNLDQATQIMVWVITPDETDLNGAAIWIGLE